MRRIITAGLAGFTACALAAGQRTNELGVVDYYAKYEANTALRTERSGKGQKAEFGALKNIVPGAEWVDVDIFLRDRKTERNAFKRILLLSNSEVFTREMYEGMGDYIRSGGLLITCVSCVYEDKNANYCHDNSDPTIKYTAQGFLGAEGSGDTLFSEIKVAETGPITKGLTTGAWLPLAREVHGREVKIVTARVALAGRQRGKSDAPERPFLVYKNYGKGACIYLVGGLGLQNNDAAGTILRNVFSEEVWTVFCVP